MRANWPACCSYDMKERGNSETVFARDLAKLRPFSIGIGIG